MNAAAGDVAVVIPNRNGAGLVGRCVRAAATAGAAEIVVVDDGSTDNSPAEATTAGATVVVANGRGFSTAVNMGVAATTAPYVLILNSDCFLEPAALGELRRTLDGDPGLGLCGAALEEPDGALGKSYGALITLPIALRSVITGRGGPAEEPALSGAQAVQFVPLACALVPRRVFDEVGGLDERFLFYFEDHDFCLRLARAGYRIAVAWEARAVHVGGGSSSVRDPQRWFRQYNESRGRYVRKHHPRGFVLFEAVWIPAALVHAAVWALRRRPESRAWAKAYLASAAADITPERPPRPARPDS